MKRSKSVLLSGFNDTVYDGTCLGTLRCVRKQPVFPSDHKGFDRAFGPIIIQFQSAIFKKSIEGFPAFSAIFDGGPKSAFRQHPWWPAFEAMPKKPEEWADFFSDESCSVLRQNAFPFLVLKTAERNEGMQRIVGREDRLLDDDGGHLIGSQFHGSGDIDNLVAQNSQINRSGGIWYNMEQEWANALKETQPRQVRVKIKPYYSGNSLRSDKFQILYEIEGKGILKKIIKNQVGG